MSFLKYYWNPIILTFGTIVYFSPFFLPIVPGGVSGKIFALFALPFISFFWAWLVALIQVVLAILNYRKGIATWKHHVISAGWVFLCYGVWMVLVTNGYLLTT